MNLRYRENRVNSRVIENPPSLENNVLLSMSHAGFMTTASDRNEIINMARQFDSKVKDFLDKVNEGSFKDIFGSFKKGTEHTTFLKEFMSDLKEIKQKLNEENIDISKIEESIEKTYYFNAIKSLILKVENLDEGSLNITSFDVSKRNNITTINFSVEDKDNKNSYVLNINEDDSSFKMTKRNKNIFVKDQPLLEIKNYDENEFGNIKFANTSVFNNFKENIDFFDSELKNFRMPFNIHTLDSNSKINTQNYEIFTNDDGMIQINSKKSMIPSFNN